MFSVGKGSIIFTMIEGSTHSLTLLLLYTEEYTLKSTLWRVHSEEYTLKICISVVDIYVWLRTSRACTIWFCEIPSTLYSGYFYGPCIWLSPLLKVHVKSWWHWVFSLPCSIISFSCNYSFGLSGLRKLTVRFYI